MSKKRQTRLLQFLNVLGLALALALPYFLIQFFPWDFVIRLPTIPSLFLTLVSFLLAISPGTILALWTCYELDPAGFKRFCQTMGLQT